MNEYQELFSGYDVSKDLEYVVQKILEYERNFSCGLKYFGDLHFHFASDFVINARVRGYRTICFDGGLMNEKPFQFKDHLSGLFEVEFLVQDDLQKWICFEKRNFEYVKPNISQYGEMIPLFFHDLKNRLDEIQDIFRMISLFGYERKFTNCADDKIILFSKPLPLGKLDVNGNRKEIWILTEFISSRRMGETPRLKTRYDICLMFPMNLIQFDGKTARVDETIEEMKFSIIEGFAQSIARFEKKYILSRYEMSYFMSLPEECKDLLIKTEIEAGVEA